MYHEQLEYIWRPITQINRMDEKQRHVQKQCTWHEKLDLGVGKVKNLLLFRINIDLNRYLDTY
jgi:hypothetical protein